MTEQPNPTENPGFYRFKVGHLTVTLVHDGAMTRPLDASFVANTALDQVQAALDAARQPTATITIPFTSTVLDDGQQLVLIDAGNGEFGPRAGYWERNFQAAGYRPEQVDLVVASHLHADHIQGIRRKDGTPTFQNARLMAPADDWAFWMDEGRMSRAPEAMQPRFELVHRVYDPVRDAVELFQDEKEIFPGLTARRAPGHTPGHTAFTLASGDDSLLIWSDTTNKPELFVRNPGWHAAFDIDPHQAEATRRRLLDMAATDRLHISGYHFPFPAHGYITRAGQSYDYVPAFWEAG